MFNYKMKLLPCFLAL